MQMKRLRQYNITHWYLLTNFGTEVILPSVTSVFGSYHWGGNTQSNGKPIAMPSLIGNTAVRAVTIRVKAQKTGATGTLKADVLWTNFPDAADTAADVQLNNGKWRPLVGTNWNGSQTGASAISLMVGASDDDGEISGLSSWVMPYSVVSTNGYSHPMPDGFLGVRIQQSSGFTTASIEELIVELWG